MNQPTVDGTAGSGNGTIFVIGELGQTQGVAFDVW